mmetsp:Transcript_16948/g.12116  ORF Transcript_16948/g.12116 Transcript_16948/m.12116 type:complete len:196 (+) Transcript_16948:732-1319(+)
MMSYFSFSYSAPIMTMRLLEFSLTEIQIGFVFGITSVFFIVFCFVVSYIPKGIEKRVIIEISLIMLAVSALFLGPSQILHFPESLLLICIGQMLRGAFFATLLIPIMGEMIESATLKIDGSETSINDKCSAIFNASLGVGNVVSPIFGAFLESISNYKLTNDAVALLFLVIAAVYYGACSLPEAIRISRWSSPVH